MKVRTLENIALFDYNSTTSTLFELNDVVIRKGDTELDEKDEIGVIIQINEEHEFRTEMFGNCCSSEIKLATYKEIEELKPALIKTGNLVTFDNNKKIMLDAIDTLLAKYDEFTKEISPKNWRVSGNYFSELKKMKDDVNYFTEINEKERKWVKENEDKEYEKPEKVNVFTSFFADKIGDKIIVEVEVTGDPNEVASTLYKSFNDDKDLIKGGKVSQILFKGKSAEQVVDERIDNALLDARNKFVEAVNEIRAEVKDTSVKGIKKI